MEGLVPGESVTVNRVDMVGDSAVTVHFRDASGRLRSRMCFADDLATFNVHAAPSTGALDADPRRFLEAFDAHRVQNASLYDRLLAVNSANIDPLPHQLGAVYGSMLPRRPLRFLLADDPGAGKTIMAGLYIRELMARHIARRCMVVAPGSLVEQWQEELQSKFGLQFALFDRAMLAGDANPFLSEPALIVRVDQVARDRTLMNKLRESRWDLTIVDEAHKLSARYWGHEVKRSRRYALGELLADVSSNFLLMTATPHSGKEDDFQLFMRLLDADRFLGRAAHHEAAPHARDLMRRLVKEQLRHMDGRRLFPERRATTIHYQLQPQEQILYDRVTSYVRQEMNKISGDRTRRTVGFALLILQRRLASSPEAILRSLQRRRDRLMAELERVRERDAAFPALLRNAVAGQWPGDEDDLPAAEREVLEDEVSEAATTARTPVELEAEVQLLDDLVTLAQNVRDARVDQKWEQLSRLLSSTEMHDSSGERRKIIIFTEHRDTLTYLEERISEQLGNGDSIVTIHGGLTAPRRREAQRVFWEDRSVSVLLGTDAAGEGVNLQCANLMVNYDLPWNPNRLEQRFGRIHRIGQTEVCHLWNLVANDTREGYVFTTLLRKLESQRTALGDRVFDVLGEVLTGRDLSELLTEAIRSEDPAGLQERLRAVIDAKVGRDMDEALDARARTVGELTDEDVDAARRELAQARATSLQPTVVERFVRKAAAETRCELVDAGSGVFRAERVSEAVRNPNPGPGGRRVRSRYDHLTFDIDRARVFHESSLELLSPGHSLVDALAAVMGDRFGNTLERGTVLRDPQSEKAYVLALFRHGVRSEAGGGDDGLLLEEQVLCLRLDTDGSMWPVAPWAFTALSVPEDASSWRDQPGAMEIAEAIERARRHVVEEAASALLAEVEARLKEQREAELDAARRRLTSEIQRQESRASQLRSEDDREELLRVRQRIEDLRSRRDRREREVAEQCRLRSLEPHLVAVAGVVPAADPGTETALEAARETVRGLLADTGRIDTPLPLAGYDFMLTRPDLASQPSFITVKLVKEGNDWSLSDAERLVRANQRDAYHVALVDEAGGLAWVEERSPFETK